MDRGKGAAEPSADDGNGGRHGRGKSTVVLFPRARSVGGEACLTLCSREKWESRDWQNFICPSSQ